MGERALANGRSDTRELPLHTERSPNSNVSGVAPDDIPRFYPLLGPFPAEIFLGRRYSRTATAKSRSCQAFLQAYVADLFPPSCHPSIWCSLSAPFALVEYLARLRSIVRACAFYFYLSPRPDFIPHRRTRSANRRRGS